MIFVFTPCFLPGKVIAYQHLATKGCVLSTDRSSRKHLLDTIVLAQQTRNIEPMLGQYRPAVYDVGPTLAQHWFNVSCLLGGYQIYEAKDLSRSAECGIYSMRHIYIVHYGLLQQMSCE